MTKVNKLFPKGNKKALTLSYDDGVTQDRRLVQIFNKYNLKGTFNLNSGLQSEENAFVIDGLVISRLNRLVFSAGLTYVYNPSASSVWIEVNETIVEIKAGETKALGRY
jgi:hypothetical protein